MGGGIREPTQKSNNKLNPRETADTGNLPRVSEVAPHVPPYLRKCVQGVLKKLCASLVGTVNSKI